MNQAKTNLPMLALTAFFFALAFALSPLARAEESAAADAPRWFCAKTGSSNFNLTCRPVCVGENHKLLPENGGGESVANWACPNSDLRNLCQAFPCSSEEECLEEGVSGYSSCHNNDGDACATQAQTATDAVCVEK